MHLFTAPVDFTMTIQAFEVATLHTQCQLIMPPLCQQYICRSEQLESAISESTPKQDADVESKHEGEIEAMPDDSAAKEKENQ